MTNPRYLQKTIRRYLEEKARGEDTRKDKKRASKARRAEKDKGGGPRRKVRHDDWEDLIEGDAPELELERTPKAGSTKSWEKRLREADAARGEPAATGDDDPEHPGALPELEPGQALGEVVFVTSGACRVDLGEQQLPCGLAPSLRETPRGQPVLGDLVVVDTEAERVEQVLPRRSVLARLGDDGRERLFAANVDRVVVVAALRRPPLRVGLVERILLAVRRGGAEGVVCVTKTDLADELESELAVLDPVVEAGTEVLACSSETGAGIDALAEALVERTCVFVGHSGVGKSSLVNALAGEERVRTGRVRTGDGKGRHTTTASSLVTLSPGLRVIDTPGIRSFGLGTPSPEELEEAFPEVAQAAAGCRFRDCRHDAEPGCAVRAALEVGELAPGRFASWRRIQGLDTP